MKSQGRAYLKPHLALASVVGLLAAVQCAFLFVAESMGILMALASTLTIYGLISFLEIPEGLSRTIEDISLLFIYVMLMSSLPWFFFSQDLLVPAVYSIVLALCLWRIYSRNLSLQYLGFVRKGLMKNCLIGVAAGMPAGVIEYLILRPTAATLTFDLFYFAQTGIYMFLFVAIGEEILFRALIQKSIAKVTGAVHGILWGALIFAVMHSVWRSVPELIFTFVAGLLLGAMYDRTESLIGPIFFHGTNNLILLAVMPYLM